VGIILCVAGLKGGVGKSTIARNIAAALSGDGHRVLVVDGDARNRSCLRWSTAAAEAGEPCPPVVGLEPGQFVAELPRLAADYDALIVDTAAQLGPEAVRAMLVSDLVVLPTRLDADDVRSLSETLEALEQARASRPDLIARVVLNGVDRTVVSRSMRLIVEGSSAPLCKTSISYLSAFREANALGVGVVSLAPRGEAARQVRALCRELLEVLRQASEAAAPKAAASAPKPRAAGKVPAKRPAAVARGAAR
jgi:chromosome partitioning protein